MEFARAGLVLVIFLSVGRSAPVTDCESLTQTLPINRENLLGKWFQLSQSSNNIGSQVMMTTYLETAWRNITAASEDDGVEHALYYKVVGRCFSVSLSCTLVNNTMIMGPPFPAYFVLLNTGCPDCLVFSVKVTSGTNTYTTVQLLSRRSEVTADELEEFKKQVECLGLPAPAVLDAKKGFCPDKSESQETKTTDLTDYVNNMGSDARERVNSYFKSESEQEALTNPLMRDIAALKQQQQQQQQQQQ